MDWISLLVIFLFVAVFILNQLAKSQQRKAPPRAERDEDEAPQRRRRPMTQLEKFLEDMQRRKEGEDVRTAAPIYEAVEVPSKPAPPPLRTVEQRRKPAAPVVKKPPRRVEARVVIEPSPPAPESQPPPSPEAPQPIHRPEALPAKAPQSPAVKMVRALLKNRQSLGAAFLLREILDRPRCRRPR
jgi:hypothetical protein